MTAEYLRDPGRGIELDAELKRLSDAVAAALEAAGVLDLREPGAMPLIVETMAYQYGQDDRNLIEASGLEMRDARPVRLLGDWYGVVERQPSDGETLELGDELIAWVEARRRFWVARHWVWWKSADGRLLTRREPPPGAPLPPLPPPEVEVF